jgi:hypothetical protein
MRAAESARARTAAHTGRSLLSTAHPHPRRYRCPNPGHPSGRAVARNTAPCGNGPRGRRRASCGRPWRLDLPDRRWQRQRAKRQVTSTAWPLRNRSCTKFQGRARQQLPAQTAFYPCYLLPETCWEQCPALLEGSLRRIPRSATRCRSCHRNRPSRCALAGCSYRAEGRINRRGSKSSGRRSIRGDRTMRRAGAHISRSTTTRRSTSLPS